MCVCVCVCACVCVCVYMYYNIFCTVQFRTNNGTFFGIALFIDSRQEYCVVVRNCHDFINAVIIVVDTFYLQHIQNKCYVDLAHMIHSTDTKHIKTTM